MKFHNDYSLNVKYELDRTASGGRALGDECQPLPKSEIFGAHPAIQ